MNGMPIAAVVFDIGGVLEINPRTGWPERWAARLELDTDDFERRLDRVWRPGSVGTVDLAEIERQTAAEFDLGPRRLADLMDDAWTEYIGTLNTEVADLFAGLRGRYRTAILSNSFVGAREREQAAYGFEDMCDLIVYSHEVGCVKPDPRIYQILCDRLAVAPGDTLFLDDVQSNVDAAQAVGMRAIRFISSRQAMAELQRQLPTDGIATR